VYHTSCENTTLWERKGEGEHCYLSCAPRHKNNTKFQNDKYINKELIKMAETTINISQDPALNDIFSNLQSQLDLPVTSSDPSASGSARGLSGKIKNTRAQATAQDNSNYNLLKDWRVRLSLANGANYLYKNPKTPGILAPLANTNGVVFPYTPVITVNYVAGYEPTDLIHSNYKTFHYRNSAIDSISISGDFTAQDTYEANYLLAVIHFFRSVTKMFYGQDSNPVNGTPPPLCYLHGFGAFNFDTHPLVISNFSCTFPNDVDYIRATTHDTIPAGANTGEQNVNDNSTDVQEARMNSSQVYPGGRPKGPTWNTASQFSGNTGGTVDPTYVPTKTTIQLTAYPIVSRNDISRNFSLDQYATGKLLRRGIW